MTKENGWSAGEVTESGEDGFYEAHIDLTSGGRIHGGAVVVYGKGQEEATGRRNFILRAVADHIGRNGVLVPSDVEKLAESCGLSKMEPNNWRPGAPSYVGGLWSNLMAFGVSVPAATRTLLYRLRNDLRVALGDGETCTMSDLEMVDAVRALKAGLRPVQEPTDDQAQAYLLAFAKAGEDGVTLRDAVKVGIKAALSK